MKKPTKGAEGFESFYLEVFGDRWESLKSSLLKEKKHVAFANPWQEDNFLPEGSSEFNDFLGFYSLDSLWPRPKAGKEGLSNYYLMDLASVLAPQALQVEEDDKVLDLCAAPGGKSLILASHLSEGGELISNDRSRDRRGRLKNVFDDYLPEEIKKKVRVTGHDATSWCLHETEAYDKILLDAPCSSERHVLESPKHLQQWSLKRTKSLATIQWAMLASAVDVLKVGGRLVYSTCALSPLENDRIIEKLLKKRGEKVELINSKFPIGEKTQYGWEILPDRTGWGPFYLAVIERVK